MICSDRMCMCIIAWSVKSSLYVVSVLGQNGMDKMVYGQNGIGQNGTDKMVQIKYYE